MFIRNNLSHLVVQELGKAIICDEFVGCEFPSEANLCEQYGVSRSAIREAVKMLSAKGLIVSTQRVGIKICPKEDWNIFDPEVLNWMLASELSTDFLNEFSQMRISIEPQAVFLATKNASDTQLNVIAQALEGMKTAEKNSTEYLHALIAFHVGVLYATNNRFYIRIRNFISAALRSKSTNAESNEICNGVTISDYIKIFNAIKNGHPERAKYLMELLIDDEAFHV